MRPLPGPPKELPARTQSPLSCKAHRLWPPAPTRHPFSRTQSGAWRGLTLPPTPARSLGARPDPAAFPVEEVKPRFRASWPHWSSPSVQYGLPTPHQASWPDAGSHGGLSAQTGVGEGRRGQAGMRTWGAGRDEGRDHARGLLVSWGQRLQES